MACGYYFIIEINGHTVTIKGDGYRDRESADRAFATALNDCPYRPPRWWQIHRWGESRPRREAFRRLRSNEWWV